MSSVVPISCLSYRLDIPLLISPKEHCLTGTLTTYLSDQYSGSCYSLLRHQKRELVLSSCTVAQGLEDSHRMWEIWGRILFNAIHQKAPAQQQLCTVYSMCNMDVEVSVWLLSSQNSGHWGVNHRIVECVLGWEQHTESTGYWGLRLPLTQKS